MATAQPNHRASLLAGLRTGGVRSVSTPMPHTAAPAGSFHIPHMRAPSAQHPHHFPEEEEMDQLAGMFNNQANLQRAHLRQSLTAGLDSRLTQQQQELLIQRQYMAQMSAMNTQPVQQSLEYQTRANLQMQMVQVELMRLQAIAHMQQQLGMSDPHSYQQRTNGMFEVPATAGPTAQSFALNGSTRFDQVRSRPSDATEYGVGPMTAGINGRFGSRSADHVSNPARSATSSVIPSKSDSAVSWRRGSIPTAEGTRAALGSPPKSVSPPSSDSEKESYHHASHKARPKPLRFTSTDIVTTAAVIGSNDDSGSDSSSCKSDTEQTSSPTTPLSSSSNQLVVSGREEPSKKTMLGLGMGRPSIHITAPSECQVVVPSLQARVILQPIRQPRGPPGAVDELGDKNFANRIRKNAIGGLGVLLEARERRDSADIESF